MSERYKAGSRIQQMWAVWEKEGTEKATAFGPSLNLSPNTIRSWCRSWEREGENGGEGLRNVKAPKTPKVPKATKAPKEPGDPAVKKLPKRIGGYKFNPTGKQRIRCTYMPTRLGWLIAAGPEQSEVRWDDDFGEICIINSYLKEVTPAEEAAWKKKYKTEEQYANPAS